MSIDTAKLLNDVLACRSPESVEKILEELGDYPGAGISKPFGPNQLRWVPFGQNPSNISTIGLATKPGKSLSERITNAIDALLEERAQHGASLAPASPREAAEAWFGRPLSGPDSGLFQGLSVPTDRKISVVLLESGRENCPTVDVIDNGVGIRPQDLQGTILSLQAGNKITKRHQIGAFGQGGSSTLGFSDFVAVVSRHHEDPTSVVFTVIRVLKLDETYKEDCYAYLADFEGKPLTAKLVASLALYGDAADLNPPSLPQGTLIRHFAYRLGNIAKSLGPSPGNLYHYLHYTLFDPILPFRVWDLRAGNQRRSEYVGGSRNRLMRILGKSEDQAGNVQVRHHRPMEYIVPSRADTPCIGIEYWVVLAFKKQGDNEASLRGNSAELFVQSGHPIVGTLNGQTQGELTGQILKEVGLGLLARHMIVHIDASAADSRVRRELFSTSREGFKEGPVLESITSTLKKMLEEDAELEQIEQELTERLSKRDNASTRDEVRQQVTRLLREAGMQVSEQSKADVQGKGPEQDVPRKKKRIYVKPDPLPTLPFPGVTFLKIASPENHLKVALNDSELVLVETDADGEYHRRGLIGVTSTNDSLQVVGLSTLRGGRIRWRLRASDNAVAGAKGEVRAFLTKPNGQQLDDKVTFEILPARQRPAKKGNTVVPPFEIEPVSPDEEEKWALLWPEDNGDSEMQARHAYKSHEHAGKTWVYYSTAFPAYATALDRLKATKPELVAPFATAYEVWIAYHAILQKQAEDGADALGDSGQVEQYDRLLDDQRAVVATMQVKQATQFAELWKKTLQATVDA